jgi:MATE family multidrug resistance protein
MMATLGKNHLTVAGIVQNILILFNFFGDGLARAVSTLAGNALGAKHPQVVFKIVRSGLILMTCFAICFALLLGATYQLIMDWFLHSVSPSEQALLFSSLLFGLGNAVIYKYLEGIRLVFMGALNAAADTLFLLVGGSCSIWIFMVLPVYTFAWRFYSRAWQKNPSLVGVN